jgi:hypothetical protein
MRCEISKLLIFTIGDISATRGVLSLNLNYLKLKTHTSIIKNRHKSKSQEPSLGAKDNPRIN